MHFPALVSSLSGYNFFTYASHPQILRNDNLGFLPCHNSYGVVSTDLDVALLRMNATVSNHNPKTISTSQKETSWILHYQAGCDYIALTHHYDVAFQLSYVVAEFHMLWDVPQTRNLDTRLLGQNEVAYVIRLKRIYNFWCSMLVLTPFAYCFVTLRGIFMHFPELT
jgi:hypothetical protein